MKLLDKIKNAIFEDDEIEETEVVEKKPKEEKKEKEKDSFEDEVVKKIDIEKTIPKRIDIREEVEKREPVLPKREHRVTPVIFDEEDFIMEDEPVIKPKREIKKEEPKKPLYAGYKDEKPKEKFKPSPIISPVYGFVGVSPVLEQPRSDDLSSFNEMFAKEKEETITLDSVRNKAYGNIAPVSKHEQDEDDDLGLLYDMKQEEPPAISKITLGDAEEYFDDLGLEYNVDYKDSRKEKSSANVSHTKKNKDLIEQTETDLLSTDDEIIDIEPKIETTQELEITKEQIKPKTAKEIKKVKKIKDLDISGDTKDTEEPDEKNLYDLIDMMYESNE